MGTIPVGLVGALLVAVVQRDGREPNDGRDNLGADEAGESLTGDPTREDDDWDAFEADLDESERVGATFDLARDETELAPAFTDDHETGVATIADIGLVAPELTDPTLGSCALTAPPDTTTTVRTRTGPNSRTGPGGVARLRTRRWGRVDGRSYHSNGHRDVPYRRALTVTPSHGMSTRRGPRSAARTLRFQSETNRRYDGPPVTVSGTEMRCTD